MGEFRGFLFWIMFVLVYCCVCGSELCFLHILFYKPYVHCMLFYKSYSHTCLYMYVATGQSLFHQSCVLLAEIEFLFRCKCARANTLLQRTWHIWLESIRTFVRILTLLNKQFAILWFQSNVSSLVFKSILIKHEAVD